MPSDTQVTRSAEASSGLSSVIVVLASFLSATIGIWNGHPLLYIPAMCSMTVAHERLRRTMPRTAGAGNDTNEGLLASVFKARRAENEVMESYRWSRIKSSIEAGARLTGPSVVALVGLSAGVIASLTA